MAKTLRILVDPRFDTKNAELSFPELDTNFIEIQDEIDNIADALLAIVVPTEGAYSVDSAALVLNGTGQAITFNGLLNADRGDIIEQDGGDLTKLVIEKAGAYEFMLRVNLAIADIAGNDIENVHFYLKKFNADDLDDGEILKLSYFTKEWAENNPQVVEQFMCEPAILFQVGEIVRIYMYRSGAGSSSLQAVNPSVPDPDLGATAVLVAASTITITTLITG